MHINSDVRTIPAGTIIEIELLIIGAGPAGNCRMTRAADIATEK